MMIILCVIFFRIVYLTARCCHIGGDAIYVILSELDDADLQ